MKFEDIRFTEGEGKYANTLGIYLPGGFFVFTVKEQGAKAERGSGD
jgi:hypothetical protein